MRPSSNNVKNTLKKVAGTAGKSKFPTAPIPAMSAPIFMMIAGKLNSSMRYKTGRG